MTQSDQVFGYDAKPYDQAELRAVMRATYDELIDFVTTPEFQSILSEMHRLHQNERPKFVVDVLMSKDALSRRGVSVPDGILIQRSAFGDRRPTLFVVKKFLQEGYNDIWQNVNLTFDNQFLDSSVSRETDLSWREPLNFNLQANAIADGKPLESI